VDRQGREKQLLRANPDKPNLSLLVALQDNTRVVVFPHSHRYFPKVSGGRLSTKIHPVTVVLNSGHALLFRQNLVHHGAPSTGVNHRVLWYIDAVLKSSKQTTFYVNPVLSE